MTTTNERTRLARGEAKAAPTKEQLKNGCLSARAPKNRCVDFLRARFCDACIGALVSSLQAVLTDCWGLCVVQVKRRSPSRMLPEHLQRNFGRSGRFFIVGYDADII